MAQNLLSAAVVIGALRDNHSVNHNAEDLNLSIIKLDLCQVNIKAHAKLHQNQLKSIISKNNQPIRDISKLQVSYIFSGLQ